MVTTGTRKLWKRWEGTLHWIAELPRKYVGTVQERSFPRIGCAKRGSADFCYEVQAVTLVWQGTKSLCRQRKKTCECRRAYTWSTFSLTWPLRRFLPVAHFATHRMLPVWEQLSHPTWHCVLTAKVPASGHRVSFRRLFWDPGTPWRLVFLPGSGRSESSRWAKHDAELSLTSSLQDNACWPRGSTMKPQRQEWASQIAQPRWRPTATFIYTFFLFLLLIFIYF